MASDTQYIDLSQEEIALREMVRDFVRDKARPASNEYEAAAKDPTEMYALLGSLGLSGLPFEAEFGGGGQPYRTYLLVFEELARAWVGLAIGLGVHTLCIDGISKFGDPAMKQRLLPLMLAGGRYGAYALSEPSSGSDASALATRAERSNGGYVLNGQKQFCTRGGEADHVLVMARTGGEGPGGISAFIVDKATPGFNPTRTENKMGWRSSPTWELVFDDCKVSEECLVGTEGIGFKIALSALDAGRLSISACAVGLAQAAMDASIKFASEREQFNSRIIDFQGIGFMLADMGTSIEAGRALYRHAAALKDKGMPYSKEASMAKLFCTDMAMRVTIDAVQIHGGYGYVEEYPVERYMREAKALQIVEGTNQIQRMIIARHLSKP
ncbi:MAG: acyl-CoA dehydrogenase family protein [Actinomycetota bacterium]